MTRCGTTCAGITVALTGLGFLISALMNNRMESVDAEVRDVHAWEAYERAFLKDTTIHVTATLPSISYLEEPQPLEVQLKPTDEEDWSFQDSEDMRLRLTELERALR